MPARLQDSLCFAVGRGAVGKEHRSELTNDEVEGRVLERKRLSIRLVPLDATVRGLARSRIVKHRLVEVRDDIACVGKSRRQCAGHDTGARGNFQNGAWRQGRYPLCNICGERLKY